LNKTVQTAASVTDFLATVAGATRQRDAATLLAMMREVTRLEPKMWGASIVGFGVHCYAYASGRTGETMAIGFAPRKNELCVYLMCALDAHADLLPKLGNYKAGKGCLYIRDLDDVDLTTLRTLLVRAAAMANPQEVEAPAPRLRRSG
jgi:hypothetical protein